MLRLVIHAAKLGKVAARWLLGRPRPPIPPSREASGPSRQAWGAAQSLLPTGRRVGVIWFHHIPQPAEQVLLVAFVLPPLVAVPQGRVEHPPLAVLLYPRQGVVLVLPLALAGLPLVQP